MKLSFAVLIPAIALASAMTTASSQEMQVPPVTTADPGFLFPNDARARAADPRLNPGGRVRERNADAPATERRRIASRPDSAEIRSRYESLRPEFERRAQRDGMPEAKRWLTGQAREMGRREGQAARHSTR